MDIWHLLGRVFRISNLGTAIFFVLNIILIIGIFGNSTDVSGLIALYFLTTIISLSPLGEWILCIVAGAEDIKRKDVKIRIIPLVEIVLDSAKKNALYSVDYVNVKIIHDQSANAFALGRNTIAITDGLLELPDNIIMAIIAHEIGHLAYGHTTLQLLIGGGNVFITFWLVILKIICWMFTALMGIVSFSEKSWILGLFTVLFTTLSNILLWLWIKFCKLFLMWSMRKNEYVADEYAVKLGFGYDLAYSLDNSICDVPHRGFLHALFEPRPSNDDRVTALQDLGVNYSRY